MSESNATLIESLPFGAAICDARGTVLRGNRRLREWLELSDDFEIGEALAAVLGTDWFSRLPFEFVPASGMRRLALSLGGSGEHRMLIVEDRSEARLLESARDLVAKRLSHDMRSPVAAIIGLARSVVEGVLPPDKEGFERILQQAELALSRSDAMLSVLRASALSTARFEPVDLVRVVHEAGDLCWAGARRRGVAFSVEDPSGVEGECLVFGELESLRRAAQHVVELALQRGAGSALVLRLSNADGDWRIEAQTEQLATSAPSEAETLLMRIVAHKHGGRVVIEPATHQAQLLLPKLAGAA